MGQTLITETWRQAENPREKQCLTSRLLAREEPKKRFAINCRAYFDGRTDVMLVYFSCNGDAG